MSYRVGGIVGLYFATALILTALFGPTKYAWYGIIAALVVGVVAAILFSREPKQQNH